MTALIAIYGIALNREAITHVATNEIKRAMCQLRNSSSPTAEYGRLESFPKEAFRASTSFPTEFTAWRTVGAMPL